MKTKKIRLAVATAIFVVLSIGLIAYIGFGTMSGFGWQDIAALCPLGAFTTMIATKTFVPRAVVSIVVMGVLVLVFGRAFCGWICPVPLLQRVKGFFSSAKKRKAKAKLKSDEAIKIAAYELGCKHDCGSCKVGCGSVDVPKRAKFDSRHYVLGGALLSTAIFGFPVFCLVCPVGLTFATVLLVWRLFAFGDMTIAVVLVPAVLILEVLVLRKWCTRFCPLAALMNLLSRFSRTTLPEIDESKCIETVSGKPCSRCAVACDADINLRHPDFGERTLADCTRCRSCVDACPAHAISMPLVRTKAASGETIVQITEPVDKAGA